MAQITAGLVKELRERTGAGMMDCKKALAATEGDMDKAIDFLREKGLAAAAKKAGRIAAEGLVVSYVSEDSKVGVIVEVNCETDFVANGDVFKGYVHDIALQIAAAKPLYVKKEDVPAEEVEHEKNILKAQIANDPKMASKPAQIIEKMVEGRIEKYYKEVCLLEQPFVKNPDVTIGGLVIEATAKIGEKISVRRFVRFEMGEGLEKKVDNLAEEVAKMANK